MTAPKSVLEHLKDLRKTIILACLLLCAGAAAGYALYSHIIAFLAEPVMAISGTQTDTQAFMAVSVFEGFILRLKTAFISGAVLSLPFQIVNLFSFISPGLTKKEKRILYISTAAGSALAVGAVLYTYYVIVPLSLEFLTSGFFIPAEVELKPVFNQNISYIIQFLGAGALVFQMPVVMFGILRTGIVSSSAALRASRYIIVGAFIVAAVLSPPDVISQILLALPLIGLYFLAIGLNFITGGGK